MAMIRGKERARCIERDQFLLIRARPKGQYGEDGKPTNIMEAVRLTAVSQEVGEINIDLVPYSQEKLERCSQYFGTQFTIADLVNIENFRVYVYKGNLCILVTASDLQPQIDPWEDADK